MWKRDTITLIDDPGIQYLYDNNGQKENQIFMRLKLQHVSSQFTICNTHLKGAKPGNEHIRVKQVQQILECLQSENKNVFIAGDFNEVSEMPAIQEILKTY